MVALFLILISDQFDLSFDLGSSVFSSLGSQYKGVFSQVLVVSVGPEQMDLCLGCKIPFSVSQQVLF